MKLSFGPGETLFLQVQPNLITHFEGMWNPMLIMVLLILGIGFLQDVLDLFTNVLNSFNEPGCSIFLCVLMGRVDLCGCKLEGNINGSQGLESEAYLKRVVSSRAMNGVVVTVLNIRKTIIPCVGMLRVVHLQNVHDHPIYYLRLGMEGGGFGELCIQQ